MSLQSRKLEDDDYDAGEAAPSKAASNLSFFVSAAGNFSVQCACAEVPEHSGGGARARAHLGWGRGSEKYCCLRARCARLQRSALLTRCIRPPARRRRPPPPADNLQSASIAIPFMISAADVVTSKSNHLVGDFTEPQWAKDGVKGAVFAGAFVGMITMGYLGDLLGRRVGMMVTLSIVVLSAAATAAAPLLSSDPWAALIVLRTLLGVGVGGIYPMAAATAAEAKGAAKSAADEAAGLVSAAWGFFYQAVGSCFPYLLGMLLLRLNSPVSASLTAVQAAVLMGSGVVPAAIVLLATFFTQKRAAPQADAGGKVAERKPFSTVIREHPEYLRTLIGTGGTWCAERAPRAGGARAP